VDEFAGTSLAAQFSDALNWLPEATYAAPQTTLRCDAQGHPVSPATLIPTTNSDGFLVQPPLALTTLAAAEHLVGGALNRDWSCARVPQ
jgi:putative ABC transport system permease protein